MRAHSTRTNHGHDGRPLIFSDADIFIPQGGVAGDEIAHQGNAVRVLHPRYPHALVAQIILGSLEGDIFADNDAGNSVEQNGAAAHRAGREGRINNAPLINRRALSAGILEAIHFTMAYDAAVLHALIVAASDYFSIADQD